MKNMAEKNFLRIDKVKQFGHIETLLAEDELLNGHFAVLGSVVNTEEGEEVEYTLADEGGEFDVLVAPVYVLQGRTDDDILTDSVPAGKPARGLVIEKGDVVSINAELAPGVAKGDEVAVGAGGLGFKVADVDDVVIGMAIDLNWLDNVGDLAVIRFA